MVRGLDKFKAFFENHPQSIKNDLQLFVNAIANELPDKTIFLAMGQSNLNPKTVLTQLIKSFQLDEK